VKRSRIVVLFDTDTDPPQSQNYAKQLESGDEVEFEVARALISRGHDVRLVGFRNELDQLVSGLRAAPADVVFNLSERFRNVSALDSAITGLLDMLGLPFTGAGSQGLMLARDKALTKKVFHYQGLRVPHFAVFPPGKPVRRPSDLRFPLFVKPLDEDASVGISLASVVHDDQALMERVAFVHERFKTRAIVEEFIAGRELCVGVIGNAPARALPPIEMVFGGAKEDSERIATFNVKWSTKHREKNAIHNEIAQNLSEAVRARLHDVALRAYEAAELRDYARIDVRLAPDDEVYVIEANPNPYLADGEDLAWAAEEAGFPYADLIENIAEMAIARGKR
jgi:D-alanine-D-alanine ligase